MRILVAEDDPVLSSGIATALRQSSYAVDAVSDGLSADSTLKESEYDALVLDLGLPQLDGTDVLQRIRARSDDIPVLILTARDSLKDRIQGLDLGADDYMVKPFSLPELEARLRALIRRRHFRARSQVVLGRLAFDPTARRLTLDGQAVDLSAREITLFEILLKNIDRLVSKDQLLEHLCGQEKEICHNAIEVYVHRLRKKIAGSEVVLRTVRGLGYILEG